MNYSELPLALYELMNEGLYKSGLAGTCKIDLQDEENDIQFVIALNKLGLLSLHDQCSDPDVTLQMTPQILFKIISNLDRLDLRSPEILREVSANGNLILAAFLFSLIKRPSAGVLVRLEHSEKLSKEQRLGQIAEVRKLSDPSSQTVRELLNMNIPFVVTGALNNWNVSSYNLDSIKLKFGSLPLRPVINEGRYETVGDFVEKIRNNPESKVYTEGCDLPIPMRADFPLPFFKSDVFKNPQIWLGTKSNQSVCTYLHRDCNHGFLGNIFGRKKFIFYSPDQSEFLYPIKAFNYFQLCQVTQPEDVGLDDFPLFKHAKPVEVVVGPGDLLVIPAFWFHCVYAMDDVFSVSSAIHWDALDSMNANGDN
jgi:hypothetical protein